MQHPDHIGKYLVEEYLGGGMSRVYRAKDPVLGKTVAVKILTDDGSADEESRNRFLREAQLAAGIDNPNIISVYDFGEDRGRPYMVMEFLRGNDLRTVIKENRTGDTLNKLRIALQIAKALQYIHGQKIIHRDIKPENIHVNESGVVKMMDFGIAKRQDFALTQPGFTMGTPYYMAPEQVLGKEVTFLADVYAYGILLFELFTGSRPITGENIEQIFFRILQEPIDFKPLQQAAAPQSMITLISACTVKEPSKRPQNFSVICRVLVQEIEAIEGSSKPSTPAEPPRSRSGLMLTTVVLVAAVSIILVVAWFRTPAQSHGPDSSPKPIVNSVLAPVLQTRSGEMVLIPAGEFLSGPDKKRETLPSFYIDRTEVTNEAYRQFCLETHKSLPLGFDETHPAFPVVNITIDDARHFASWAGKQLPTLKKWEKAARGTDGREYPWGNENKPAFANVAPNPDTVGSLAPADAFSSVTTAWGVRQMVGNVWEFVDEPSIPSSEAIKHFREILKPPPTRDEPWYLIMGGSYEQPLPPHATYDSASVPARFRSEDIGFRCVKEPERQN